MQKIQNFTQLEVWRKAHKLVLLVYKKTKEFPKEERYSLVDQMRRCVISITSNIAEGFARNSLKEKVQFYFIARGSLTELQNQLILSKDLDYIHNEEFDDLISITVEVHKMINGLIKSIKQ